MLYFKTGAQSLDVKGHDSMKAVRGQCSSSLRLLLRRVRLHTSAEAQVFCSGLSSYRCKLLLRIPSIAIVSYTSNRLQNDVGSS